MLNGNVLSRYSFWWHYFSC